jgi:hypothetical protein
MVEWSVEAAECCRVRRLVVDGESDLGDGRGIAKRTVGDHAGATALLHPHGKDVTDRAGMGLIAGLDDQHLFGFDRLDCLTLGVRSLEATLEILALGDVAQGVGVSEHSLVGIQRLEAAEERVTHAPTLQIACQRRGGHRVELHPHVVGQGDRTGRFICHGCSFPL